MTAGAVLQAYKDGVSLDKQIKTWDMKKLSDGFDFEKWNLTNYKKSMYPHLQILLTFEPLPAI